MDNSYLCASEIDMDGKDNYAQQNAVHEMLEDAVSCAPRKLVDPAFPKAKASYAPAGRKDDSGKLDMTLYDDMPRALAAVCEVMQWAITKKEPVPYERGSWLGVSPDRYRAAIKRHDLAATKQASDPGIMPDSVRFMRDDETKLLHLAHMACSALFALELTLREWETK